MAKSIQNLGLYLTLVSQLDKLARHNRQGSFRTKERYYEALKRFCAFLADEYHLQKLENISGKHLASYVLWMQESGKSASTIKTDLAAIRFFHDKMSRPKYQLPTNDELAVELERRCFGGVDRTWSNVEFNKMLGKALAEDRYDFILALYLGRYAGLRIHECFRIDTATAERALRENAITIKGKGGKVRTVPINEQIAVAMRKQLDRTFRGQKLLVPDDMHTDRAINLLQLFIMKHRRGAGRGLRPALDLPRASPYLCSGEVQGVDRQRHERPGRPFRRVPAVGPRAGGCDQHLSGLSAQGRAPWEITE